ncbi:protein CopA/IncA [Yersinia enterocolitica]|nr:protein CopA/IncA [Yersinia enterocolitica]EKN5999231.1 protein CopA/IncA [Yersinia enterocolitica]ELI7924505.1 protein CopA/IncA [Yersinia enterocolitica]MBX9475262.1 protein CopA/IncA [Yersinia enterocolitica]HEI6777277.1 protein CopA/IncA [Yersinia enterocolitica]
MFQSLKSKNPDNLLYLGGRKDYRGPLKTVQRLLHCCKQRKLLLCTGSIVLCLEKFNTFYAYSTRAA